MRSTTAEEAVVIRVPNGAGALEADLRIPERAKGLVVFAHGSGSSRYSRRNRAVSEFLDARGFATLLLDLLTHAEEVVDGQTRQHRFDIDLLGRRVVLATDWTEERDDLRSLPLGYFGASTGAAAAMIGAAARPAIVRAVVSRGGRPDLAASALPNVAAPTLLIVGGLDEPVIDMNREAMRRMKAKAALEIVPGATHLFEEPGTLEQVMELAASWFQTHLTTG
jgi:pimeloyl-ACP methyl ester carboxylesterase